MACHKLSQAKQEPHLRHGFWRLWQQIPALSKPQAYANHQTRLNAIAPTPRSFCHPLHVAKELQVAAHLIPVVDVRPKAALRKRARHAWFSVTVCLTTGFIELHCADPFKTVEALVSRTGGGLAAATRPVACNQEEYAMVGPARLSHATGHCTRH